MSNRTDNRDTRLAVRLDAAERRMADVVARHAELTVSDWVRLQIRQAFEQLRQPVRKPPNP
jgi:hypothetical protein